MDVTVRIPEDLAERLTAEGADLARDALEGFALEAFRAGRLTRYELNGFLKAHSAFEPVTPEDIRRDLEDLRTLRA